MITGFTSDIREECRRCGKAFFPCMTDKNISQMKEVYLENRIQKTTILKIFKTSEEIIGR